MSTSSGQGRPERQEAIRESRKQVSIFIPLSDWKALRHEAARQQIPMTELCRRWLKPEMQRIHREQR